MHMLATFNNAVPMASAASTTLGGHDIRVLIVAAIGIAIVVLLIVFLKMHAFIALTIGALFVGIGSGIALDKVTASYVPRLSCMATPWPPSGARRSSCWGLWRRPC